MILSPVCSRNGYKGQNSVPDVSGTLIPTKSGKNINNYHFAEFFGSLINNVYKYVIELIYIQIQVKHIVAEVTTKDIQFDIFRKYSRHYLSISRS